MRTHIVLPDELLEEVDRLAGFRKRSQFIEEAAIEKLERERQREALNKYQGILDPSEYPEWRTAKDAAKWVRNLRREEEVLRHIGDENRS